MELKAGVIQSLIDSGQPTLVICVADWCKHCQELKSSISDVSSFAAVHHINVALIKITDQDNQEFFTKYPFETLPYCLVFVDKQFKGGENASKSMLMELIPAIAGAVARDSAIKA